MAVPTKPLSKGQKMAAALGAVALIGGIGLLLWGLAPAKGFSAAGAAFSGGPIPEDLNEQIDAALAGVIGRAWASGLGLAGILGGVIAVKEGLTQREMTVEEQVNARLEELGIQEGGAPPATASTPAAEPVGAPAPEPAAAAPTTQPVATPAPSATPPAAAPAAAPSGPVCPTCESKLIAGGTFCRRCGPVA